MKSRALAGVPLGIELCLWLRRRWRKRPPPKIDAADTAWMIAATALVLMMTIPGLALFYAGMVRKKNVLATMAQSLVCTMLCSILWFAVGYSLSFVGDGPWLGTFEQAFLRGMRHGVDQRARADHPRDAVHDLPDDVRDHHGCAGRGLGRGSHALLGLPVVRGRLADRGLRADRALGLGRRLPRQGSACSTSPAAPSCISMPGSPAWSPPIVVGKRHGYGTENFAPYNLSLAVIGTGLLWVGWFGFNGGSALGANSRAVYAIVATHLAASTGALTWMVLEWWTRGKPSVLGMISGAVAGLGTITPASGFVLPWHGVVIGADRRRALLLGLHLAQAQARLRRFARRVRRPRRRRRDRHAAHRRVRGGGGVGKPDSPGAGGAARGQCPSRC